MPGSEWTPGSAFEMTQRANGSPGAATVTGALTTPALGAGTDNGQEPQE